MRGSVDHLVLRFTRAMQCPLSWRDEPNASQVSARYAERKRAAQRAHDARPRQDPPCHVCGRIIPATAMRNICMSCTEERALIISQQGHEAAEQWERSGAYAKALRGECPVPWNPNMSTNHVLAALCITHRPTGRGQRHEYRQGRRVVFTGTLQEVNEWLISTGKAVRVASAVTP